MSKSKRAQGKTRKLKTTAAGKHKKLLKQAASKPIPTKAKPSQAKRKSYSENSQSEIKIKKLPFPLPLSPYHKILLVGEGDFSFSACLAQHYGCTTNLTCTTLESAEVLAEKYPSAEENIKIITTTTSTRNSEDSKDEGDLEDLDEDDEITTPTKNTNKILYSTDATTLSLPNIPGGALLRSLTLSYDVVWFNFPHVGGKSKDVNRQVRANQELVVRFLQGADRMLKPGGAVVMTIFEGMPYELWGVRNLARHVGYAVERSGRWEWGAWPGYRHVRTLGEIDGGGGWKGEEREARVFVFRKAGGESQNDEGKRKKRKRDDSGSESD